MSKHSSWKYIGLLSQVGLTIVIAVLISAALGYYLDQLFGTRILFTLVFIVLGSASGLWTAYKLLISISVDEIDK